MKRFIVTTEERCLCQYEVEAKDAASAEAKLRRDRSAGERVLVQHTNSQYPAEFYVSNVTEI